MVAVGASLGKGATTNADNVIRVSRVHGVEGIGIRVLLDLVMWSTQSSDLRFTVTEPQY